MANGLSNADLTFPTFTGDETSDEKTDKILNYLYMLVENLRYSLNNIDEENFASGGLDGITEPIYLDLLMLEEKVEKNKNKIYDVQDTVTDLDTAVTNLNNTVAGLNTTVTQLNQKAVRYTGDPTDRIISDANFASCDFMSEVTGTATTKGTFDFTIKEGAFGATADTVFGSIKSARGQDGYGNYVPEIDLRTDTFSDEYGRPVRPPIKLHSSGNLSAYGNTVSLLAGDGDVTITAQTVGGRGKIYLYGDVYINGVPL